MTRSHDNNFPGQSLIWMMEWRIFLPHVVSLKGKGIESSCVDVWSLLDQHRVSSEERKDVYVSCTDGVGLKVRGRSKLFEIKVRGQKYPCGAEEWNKV